MRLSRRTLIAGGLAALAAAAAAPLALRRIDDEIRRTIRHHFGDRIANSGAAADFTADFTAFLRQVLPADILRTRPGYFLLSPVNTAVRAWETGDEPVYIGIRAALHDPCQNVLGADWL